MKRSLRYLRIAFSATCLIACVLLVMLAMRSYWHCDIVSRVNKNLVLTTLGSASGQLYFIRGVAPKFPGALVQIHGWKHSSDDDPTSPDSNFQWISTATRLKILFPTWLLILPLAVFATLPWIPLRFSLRTLLIATTLIAVVLGVIAWLLR